VLLLLVAVVREDRPQLLVFRRVDALVVPSTASSSSIRDTMARCRSIVCGLRRSGLSRNVALDCAMKCLLANRFDHRGVRAFALVPGDGRLSPAPTGLSS
jgi:hypothetical protein